MLKIGDWINRKRHNRGFGIQSPSAFFFITQVLKEKLPYYAYDRLEEIAWNSKGMSARRCKELFRIANYTRPENSITIESATAACAICSARREIPSCLITEGDTIGEEAARHLKEHRCSHLHGNVQRLLEKTLEKNGECGILYIGECGGREQLLETALRYTCNRSIIIIEGIYRSREATSLWQKAIENSTTKVTYDLYSMGILMFDTEKQKQNYKLKR